MPTLLMFANFCILLNLIEAHAPDTVLAFCTCILVLAF